MIRTLIVDDEQPARDRLHQMLNSMDGIEVIGEAEDGEQAVQRILELRPDLVFLDIQMPVLTGMEVVKALKPPRPKVIFCTAFDQYALSAFEQQALDYLLKPVKRERLAQAVSRARESLENSTTLPREVTLAGQVQAHMLPQSAPPSPAWNSLLSALRLAPWAATTMIFSPFLRVCSPSALPTFQARGSLLVC